MALMMLQNAELPRQKQSNIVIEMSGNSKKDENRMKSYVINKKVVNSFMNYVEEFNKDLDPEEPIFQHDLVEKLKSITESEDGEEGFFTQRHIFRNGADNRPTDIFK